MPVCLLCCFRCLDDANDLSGAGDNDAASLVSSMVSLFWWLSVVTTTTTQVCLLCSFRLFHDAAARWCRPTTHVLSPACFRCFMTDRQRGADYRAAGWLTHRLPCRRQPATACLVSRSVVSSFHDWRNVVPTTVPPAGWLTHRLPCRRQPTTACLVSRSVVSSFHDWRNVVPTTVPPATSHGMSVSSVVSSFLDWRNVVLITVPRHVLSP